MEDRLMAIQAELGRNEEAHKSFKRRLDEHDQKLEKQTEFLITLRELTLKVGSLGDGMGRVEKKVDQMSARVDELEKEPAEKWKKITWEVIKYVVIAAIGAAVTVIVSALAGK